MLLGEKNKSWNVFNVGWKTKEIGKKLYISRYTVSRHLRNLCSKHKTRNAIGLLVKFSCFHLGEVFSHPVLTHRENQILDLIMQGFGSQDIAQFMTISSKTVRKHRENILRKLNVQSMRMVASLVLSLKIKH